MMALPRRTNFFQRTLTLAVYQHAQFTVFQRLLAVHKGKVALADTGLHTVAAHQQVEIAVRVFLRWRALCRNLPQRQGRQNLRALCLSPVSGTLLPQGTAAHCRAWARRHPQKIIHAYLEKDASAASVAGSGVERPVSHFPTACWLSSQLLCQRPLGESPQALRNSFSRL